MLYIGYFCEINSCGAGPTIGYFVRYDWLINSKKGLVISELVVGSDDQDKYIR